MEAAERFARERRERVASYADNEPLQQAAREFMVESLRVKYSYNFTWMGSPIIQHPADMLGMQELVWRVKPELIIETGIAHGGSLIFYASLLELIGHGEVIGIDIEIRPHNRREIQAHSMFGRITLIEGSSVEDETVRAVRDAARGQAPVMVVLDSNHSRDHVLRELELYASLVTVGSYCVVFDTIVEQLPGDLTGERPWGAGNSPMAAVDGFLRDHDEFVRDSEVDGKLVVTAAPGGYLRRVR